MTTIAQNRELLKNLNQVLQAHRNIFKQTRVYQRAVALLLAEVFAFGRHTITQLLFSLGMNERDWSAWYRLLKERFDYQRASEVLFRETLQHVGEEEVYVVGGDGTQTPRTSAKMEGVGWLRNMRTPPFRMGIHRAQRWFNGSWFFPPEGGYSRAMPLRWMSAFTEKAWRQVEVAYKEWEAALAFVNWIVVQLQHAGRATQRVLLLGDGSYDVVELWKALPPRVSLFARSARNRVLYHLPAVTAHRNRKYGERAATPAQLWVSRSGWKRLSLTLRGHERRLQYRVEGPFLRKGAPNTPLFLLIVRGQSYQRNQHPKWRQPVPYLVNAVREADGRWQLPFPVATLIFWAWQRWELEVCHRELKSSFGLGEKQCWHPRSAVTSVQWSAWVYSLLLLAGYRTWGLCASPPVPSRWWRGSRRWSFNTLWRAYRAAFWGEPAFRPFRSLTPNDFYTNAGFLDALSNSIHGSLRL